MMDIHAADSTVELRIAQCGDIVAPARIALREIYREAIAYAAHIPAFQYRPKRGDTTLRMDCAEVFSATHPDGTAATRDGAADGNDSSNIISALHPSRDNSAFQGGLPS